MTNEQKKAYQEPELLRKILQRVLKNKKFILDCGHHVTFGTNLGITLQFTTVGNLKLSAASAAIKQSDKEV